MTQPTDPRSSNGANASAGEASRGPSPHQDTVLLSEVPDAETLVAEAAEAANRAPIPSINATNLNLSSSALAALGQRYDILDAAGHGSMGNVYKARDRETGETVALKLLKPEIASDQQMMDRFKNELLFARKITHKNVCRVHEFNRLGGIAYTSMEFVEGESLRSVLNRFGGLPLRKGIDLAQQMCSGLKEAHAQGIVHRDLKPENVMIDERGNVKIMDFGIARSMGSLTRMTGAMVGTPAYMAPEQVAGKPVDYRTDIYSLGLMLYEVFTGTQAFTADNAVAVAMKQLRESPVPPHEIEPGIPVSIERAILKCLEKEADKRFQSITELEKVFVSATPGTALAAGSTTAGRSTQDALAMQPTVSARPVAQAAQSHAGPTKSRGKWIALGLFLVLSVLFGAGRWAKIAKLADALPLPPAPSAPAIPDFAFARAIQSSPNTAQVQKTEPNPVTAAPAPESSSAEQSSTDSSATPASALAAQTPPAPVPQSKAASSVATHDASPTDVQQRADAAFKENLPAKSSETPANIAPEAVQPMGSVLPGKGPSYIWVARFDREDRAQDASRKIQGLGLTSVVIPRHGANNAQYFAVLTGPFPPARIPSVIDWLKTQGFQNVREVKGLGTGQMGGRGSNSNSNPQPKSDGGTE